MKHRSKASAKPKLHIICIILHLNSWLRGASGFWHFLSSRLQICWSCALHSSCCTVWFSVGLCQWANLASKPSHSRHHFACCVFMFFQQSTGRSRWQDRTTWREPPWLPAQAWRGVLTQLRCMLHAVWNIRVSWFDFQKVSITYWEAQHLCSLFENHLPHNRIPYLGSLDTRCWVRERMHAAAVFDLTKFRRRAWYSICIVHNLATRLRNMYLHMHIPLMNISTTAMDSATEKS